MRVFSLCVTLALLAFYLLSPCFLAFLVVVVNLASLLIFSLFSYNQPTTSKASFYEVFFAGFPGMGRIVWNFIQDFRRWVASCVRFCPGFLGMGRILRSFVQDFRGWGASCEVLSRISGDGAQGFQWNAVTHIGIRTNFHRISVSTGTPPTKFL